MKTPHVDAQRIGPGEAAWSAVLLALAAIAAMIVGLERRRRDARLVRISSDQVLRRVAAAVANAASNPHLVRVGGRNGRVLLRGRVPAAEMEELLWAVWSVDGVVEVDNRLVRSASGGARRRFVAHRRRLRAVPALAR